MGLTRSEQMSRIGPKDTRPEKMLRRALWGRGLRYRLGLRVGAARPDIAFPRAKVVVFVDGCFWHGCPEHYVRPTGRAEFWAAKLACNVDRDRRQTAALEAQGWIVLRFWEHAVAIDMEAVVDTIAGALRPGGVQESESLTTSWRVLRVDPLEDQGGRRMEARVLTDLRDPGATRTDVRARSTTKWNRSSGS